jgi:plastocyanin
VPRGEAPFSAQVAAIGAASALPFLARMKKLLLASIGLSMLVLWALGCGGGGGAGSAGGGTPTGPSGPAPSQVSTTTVNIVASSGSAAFSPNPVQVPSGGMIQWRNSTANPHVLVMNDGTPIATLAPGVTVTTTLGAGGDFRCTTHPSMVGSINGATVPTPPDDDDGYLAPALSHR